MAKYGFDLLGIDVSPLGWPSIERTPKEGNALCSAALLRRTFWLLSARSAGLRLVAFSNKN